MLSTKTPEKTRSSEEGDVKLIFAQAIEEKGPLFVEMMRPTEGSGA